MITSGAGGTAMARSARKRTETVTVEELLRRTGATPRKIGPSAPGDPAGGRKPEALAAREPDRAGDPSARPEGRVRAVAGAQPAPGRAGVRARQLAVSSGLAVVAGGLLVLALVPEDVPRVPASLPALPPATATSPVSGGTAPPTPASIEAVAVVRTTQHAPKRPAAPVSPAHSTTPVPASEDPAPTTTTPPGYPGYPYPGYPYPGYPYPPYGGPRR